MDNITVPKWQQELRAFMGIKSGIILEGNVYDEFPIFDFQNGCTEYREIESLDTAIASLLDLSRTELIFFDPIDGFYCLSGDVENQRNTLMPMFEGYCVSEYYRNHGYTLCLTPKSKKQGGKSESPYIWASEIIHRAATECPQEMTKENIVFVLKFASRLDACNLNPSDSNSMFLNLLETTTATQPAHGSGNSIVMVVDKYNDIPAWLYLNNPNIRTVSVCPPDRNIRRLYLSKLRGALSPFQLLSNPENEIGKQFVAETEGMRLLEIHQILRLAYRADLKPDDIELAFRLYKFGVIDSPWENLENNIQIDIERKLKKRVKGQPEALEKVINVVTRAVKGLSGLQHSSASHKPKGILFFAGPTGVGKTETAKALAEAIFGDENACIRFDMSEYRLPQSDQKMFGAPPGYVGYEGGGQLTNAVKERPFSILLFDEIEKASPSILDKFLQILEDGRMTDNQGNTVYFGETIIIFTSNIGLTRNAATQEQAFYGAEHRVPTISIEDPMKTDSEEFRQEVTALLTNEVRAYFTDNGRPELLNRLGEDNIVVFQFINKDDAVAICDYKLEKICASIRQEKRIQIDTRSITDYLHTKAILARENGGRGVGNMLEMEFLNPLAAFICRLDGMPAVLRCSADETGIQFEVIENEA